MTREEIQIYTRRITNGTKTDLVVTTYDIILTYLHDANCAMEKKEEEQVIWNLNKSLGFINELIHALNLDYQLGQDLLVLYRYMQKVISRCILKKNVEYLDTVQSMITKLKSSFSEVAKQDQSGPVIRQGGQVYAGITYGKGTLNEMYENGNRGFKA